MTLAARIAVTIFAAGLVSVGLAQIAIPLFGTRGDVPISLVEEFVISLRVSVGGNSEAEVTTGDLIPPQIAGSLDPELALFIAKSDRVRFAVSGEVARVGSGVGNESYLVNLIVVDTSDGRVTDLISRPLQPGTEIAVATSIADLITTFISPGPLLPGGSSGLFISTEPGQADVFVDGNLVGETPSIGVLMLAEGRYAIEIRRRGFLLESRIVDLEGTGTQFVHVGLSPITGGIIQVDSVPSAEVFLDGKSRGRTPIAFQAQPGDPMVTLVRGGFRTLRVTPPVRNNRVTRLDERLQPVMEPLVFWPKKQDTLVFFDGEPMLEGFTFKPMGGLVMIEVRRGGSVLRKAVELPGTGAHRLDLNTLKLSLYAP